MRLPVFIIIFLLFATSIRAQQMISVTDKETHEPVARAFFIHDGDTLTYTSPQGIAMVPKVSGMITITCRDYKTIEINADSIPAVIRMKCLVERLDEVIVFGDSTKTKKKFDLPDNILLEYELKDAYNNRGVKIPMTELYKLIGYKPKSERRRNRVKKKLEEYDKK